MKTKAELLIETLTKDTGRTVFTIEETKQLQEISFLEGNYLLDEWDDDKNELDEKIKKFKSQFVLSENEWNTGIIKEESEERDSSIPRKIYMPDWCEAEKVIYTAMQEVEKMGADERLTNAINKLLEAKESVANYIDGTTTITMSEEFVRLCDYLKKEYSDSKIDFSMRFDGNHFYIHPSGKDGETIDFYLNKKQN